jgi:hypothetical protein
MLLFSLSELYDLIRVELSKWPTFSLFLYLDFIKFITLKPLLKSELPVWNVP